LWRLLLVSDVLSKVSKDCPASIIPSSSTAHTSTDPSPSFVLYVSNSRVIFIRAAHHENESTDDIMIKSIIIIATLVDNIIIVRFKSSSLAQLTQTFSPRISRIFNKA
jgi:hypothetical protein